MKNYIGLFLKPQEIFGQGFALDSGKRNHYDTKTLADDVGHKTAIFQKGRRL
jgi:hypothetical protein